MSQRHEFVMLANQPQSNIRQLCRQFQISPTTGYKWLHRFRTAGVQGLNEQSRRPQCSPKRTAAHIEQAVIAERKKHPAWGGRKLRARLLTLGETQVPSPSTITNILQRHELIAAADSHKHKPFIRFEHAQPNELWQMDFKGHFALGLSRCYPLTVLDDHSRFALGLTACVSQNEVTTRAALTAVFRRYGLPWRMTMDNGSPWAAHGYGAAHYTKFSVWLMRLGIRLSFSRPRHPQTQGKDERFHRTLAVELLRDHLWSSFAECQTAFDEWRQQYNLIRPHEALGQLVPAARYQPSSRPFPETLPTIEYDQHEIVRKVGLRGQIKYQNRKIFIGNAFARLHVALRPTTIDGVLDIYLCYQRVGSVNLNQLPKDN